MPDSQAQLTVAVVIPAYTLDRWELIKKAVESARHQSLPPQEVVLCIDNNDELYQQSQREWSAPSAGPPVRVVPNRHSDHLAGQSTHERAHGTTRRFGAGSARNAAVETLSVDVVAFLDDDAHADGHWLGELLGVYRDTDVVAVGGAPLPDYETRRPRWFPYNFDWVFGCAYEGLPTSTAPLGHLIGANMSVRRLALLQVGGFQSVDFDDLDLCMRLADRYGPRALQYNPDAVVHHHVTAERVTWRYFYRRCFFVNREKVEAFRGMGDAANLRSERQFVWRALRVQLRAEMRRLAAGDVQAPRRVAAMVTGIGLAGAGHLAGRWRR